MVQQMTTAAAAPTAPVVSALEPRSPAHPSHLPMYPHHSPSRVTAQVVGDGFCCCLCLPLVARVRRATASDAGTVGLFVTHCGTRMPAPRAAVRARAVLGLDTYGGHDWALLGLVAHGTG